MKIISGGSNPEFAQKVAEHCFTELVPTDVTRFSDGEILVEIKENIRGKDVFLVNSTCMPVNESLMEMLIMIDTAKRSSAKRISAVMPYYGYARQDRKSASRTPITAKLVADLLTKAGADRVLTMDLHAGQIQGFFDIPVDDLTSRVVFCKDIKHNVKVDEGTVFVSPDAGGVRRATTFAKNMEAYVGFVHKKRDPKIHNEVKAFTVIGEVEDRHAILFDDIIDTGGTIAAASRALIERGAKSVSVAATHGIFSDESLEKLKDTPIDEIIVTDTLKQNGNIEKIGNVKILSVSSIIATALTSFFADDSVSAIFMGENVL